MSAILETVVVLENVCVIILNPLVVFVITLVSVGDTSAALDWHLRIEPRIPLLPKLDKRVLKSRPMPTDDAAPTPLILFKSLPPFPSSVNDVDMIGV